MIKIACNKADAHLLAEETLTSGSVGRVCDFEFNEDWDGLGKIAVVKAGNYAQAVTIIGNRITIPPEAFKEPRVNLVIGVYGTDGEAIVIPTIWCTVGLIQLGTHYDGEPDAGIGEPTPELVDQMIAAMETALIQSVIAAEAEVDDGVHSTANPPSVDVERIESSEEGEEGTTLKFTFHNIIGEKGAYASVETDTAEHEYGEAPSLTASGTKDVVITINWPDAEGIPYDEDYEHEVGSIAEKIADIVMHMLTKPAIDGTAGQVLGLDSNLNIKWLTVGGEEGTVYSVNGKTGIVTLDAEDVGALPDDTELFSGDYNDLTNKPEEVTEETVSEWGFTKNTGTYSKPSGGIPKSDLATTVQTSLEKADSAYQKPNTGIPESDLASSVKSKLNGYSNPNLIDNAWFTVNQRGTNSYGTGYGLDRWVGTGTGANVAVLDKGIRMTSGSEYQYLHNRLGANEINQLIGKTVTASIMFSDGTVLSGSGTVSLSSSNTNVIAVTDIAKGTSLYFITNSSNTYHARVTIRLDASSTVDIIAVKLEVGSVSTLANDTAPNYAQELDKCKYYFERINADEYNNTIGVTMAYSASSLALPIKLAPKRIRPTIGHSESIICGTTSYSISDLTVSWLTSDINSGFFCLDINKSNAFSSGALYRVGVAANGYLDFSAEL